jgi:hypothetical protein
LISSKTNKKKQRKKRFSMMSGKKMMLFSVSMIKCVKLRMDLGRNGNQAMRIRTSLDYNKKKRIQMKKKE